MVQPIAEASQPVQASPVAPMVAAGADRTSSEEQSASPSSDRLAPAQGPATSDPVAPDTVIPNDAAIGGYVGMSFGYTRFAHRDRAELCLEGALLVEHASSLGFAGCGIVPSVRSGEHDPKAKPNHDTVFGYGGILIRHRLLSHSFYSLAAGGLVGAGGLVSTDLAGSGVAGNSGSSSPDFVFVFAPQLTAQVAMTPWLRLGLTGTYRFVAGIDSAGLSGTTVGGYSLGSQAQFGWF